MNSSTTKEHLKLFFKLLLCLALISIAWFFMTQSDSGRHLSASSLETVPSQYIEITRNELTAFPALMKAVDNGGRYMISDKEWGDLLGFIHEKQRNKYGESGQALIIKVDNQFYDVSAPID